MSNVHGFDHNKQEKPQGQGYFNGGERGGVEFYANNQANDDFKEIERFVHSERNQQTTGGRETKTVMITMYRNGFTLDNGTFRPYTDPQNKEFIESVKQGYIPQELEQYAQTSNVAVDVTDHTNDMFKESDVKPKPQPSFVGAGKKLCETKEGIKVTWEGKQFDAAGEKARVKVRFHDGKSKIIMMNTTWTVKDVYAEVKKESGIDTFRLIAMPNKEVEPSDKTVKEAGLCNCSITQAL